LKPRCTTAATTADRGVLCSSLSCRSLCSVSWSSSSRRNAFVTVHRRKNRHRRRRRRRRRSSRHTLLRCHVHIATRRRPCASVAAPLPWYSLTPKRCSSGQLYSEGARGTPSGIRRARDKLISVFSFNMGTFSTLSPSQSSPSQKREGRPCRPHVKAARIWVASHSLNTWIVHIVLWTWLRGCGEVVEIVERGGRTAFKGSV